MTDTMLDQCYVHGTLHPDGDICPTWAVLNDVYVHRAEQVREYGTNADLLDGTGPGVSWLHPLSVSSAVKIEEKFREEYASHGVPAPSWMHLVREEVAEAFMETNPDRLREELIQVAALCVSWLEQLDAR